MTPGPERWRRVEDLCEQALALDARGREAFLAKACGSDEALRREIDSLLAKATQAEHFLNHSALASAAHAVVGSLPASMTGRRIGSYEIGSLLGVGGMGEVYRARDAKLGRDVAIKVLPPAFGADRERVARFDREARVLASLNHPNIAAIYGVEQIGDAQALILELVEGQTLAERLAIGSRRNSHDPGLPIAEALPIARQIVDALDAAHEKGIVHRDLKPANIKITPDGVVKVLDFGLAKGGDAIAQTGSHSPTLTMGGTAEGTILGTVAYMSPEQARGHVVDRRTDIWAFGCVLYEMLTGRAAFSGATAADHIAAILERDPEWTALPDKTPSTIRRLLRRCLEKDPKRRLRDIADSRLEIDEAISGTAVNREADGSSSSLRATIAVAVLAAVVGALATWILTRTAQPPSPTVNRFAITLPAAQPLAFSINDRDVAISADGTRLAYTAGDGAQLMVRAFDQLDSVQLSGMANARGAVSFT